MKTEAPVVTAMRDPVDPDLAYLICPYCHSPHTHSAVPGERLSHCEKPQKRRVYCMTLEGE